MAFYSLTTGSKHKLYAWYAKKMINKWRRGESAISKVLR